MQFCLVIILIQLQNCKKTLNSIKKRFIGLLKSIMKCDHFFVLSKKWYTIVIE